MNNTTYTRIETMIFSHNYRIQAQIRQHQQGEFLHHYSCAIACHGAFQYEINLSLLHCFAYAVPSEKTMGSSPSVFVLKSCNCILLGHEEDFQSEALLQYLKQEKTKFLQENKFHPSISLDFEILSSLCAHPVVILEDPLRFYDEIKEVLKENYGASPHFLDFLSLCHAPYTMALSEQLFEKGSLEYFRRYLQAHKGSHPVFEFRTLIQGGQGIVGNPHYLWYCDFQEKKRIHREFEREFTFPPRTYPKTGFLSSDLSPLQRFQINSFWILWNKIFHLPTDLDELVAVPYHEVMDEHRSFFRGELQQTAHRSTPMEYAVFCMRESMAQLSLRSGTCVERRI